MLKFNENIYWQDYLLSIKLFIIYYVSAWKEWEMSFFQICIAQLSFLCGSKSIVVETVSSWYLQNDLSFDFKCDSINFQNQRKKPTKYKPDIAPLNK